MQNQSKTSELLSKIPPPDEIRARLRESTREREVLRSLLRMSLKSHPDAKGADDAR